MYREEKLEAPKDVAEAAVKGLLNGDRRVVASNAKMNVNMSNVSPDNMMANNMRDMMEPSDKDSDDTRQHAEHEPSLGEKKHR